MTACILSNGEVIKYHIFISVVVIELSVRCLNTGPEDRLQCIMLMYILQGKLVYANFGENIDYLRLHSMNVTVNNSVLLVRHGHISYSTKVL